jgi:AmmeMemoRadiSam system protein B
MSEPSTADQAVRPARVAGSFYPGSAAELTASVQALLDEARLTEAVPAPPTRSSGNLAGLIVPHAGYVFSGPVAAAAYARLAGEDPAPSHIVVLGPAHFVSRRGAVVPRVDAWETPLGLVAIDRELRAAAAAAGAWVDDRPRARARRGGAAAVPGHRLQVSPCCPSP